MKTPPKRNSKSYWKIVEKGCGAHILYDPDGYEWDCIYYDWECDHCPCLIERQRNKNNKIKINEITMLDLKLDYEIGEKNE